MKQAFLLLTALLLAPLAALSAANVPVLLQPAKKVVLQMGIPHFEWQPCLDSIPETMPAYDLPRPDPSGYPPRWVKNANSWHSL